MADANVRDMANDHNNQSTTRHLSDQHSHDIKPSTPNRQDTMVYIRDAHSQFCSLVGIKKPNSIPTSTATNAALARDAPWTQPLYPRVLRRWTHQKWEYWFTATLSNTLLLLQILIGAVVTALGASASPHIVITVFGAINTLIAGVITYLKSRGQPMRSKAFRDELGKCLEAIHNAETMFRGLEGHFDGFLPPAAVSSRPAADLEKGAQGNWHMIVREEVERLTAQFEMAMENARQNYPDLWIKASEGQVPPKNPKDEAVLRDQWLGSHGHQRARSMG